MGQLINLKQFLSDISDGQTTESILETLTDIEQDMAVYESGIQEIRTKLEILQRDARYGKGHNPIESIKSRIKRPLSIIEKMYRKGFPISLKSMWENLNDVAGVRVICSFPSDIYQLADAHPSGRPEGDPGKGLYQKPQAKRLPQLPHGAGGSGFPVRPHRAGSGRGAAANHRDGLLGKSGASDPL